MDLMAAKVSTASGKCNRRVRKPPQTGKNIGFSTLAGAGEGYKLVAHFAGPLRRWAYTEVRKGAAMTDLTRSVARKSSQGTEDTATYHHGELPATLMTLALEHIQAHGTEKLSLRALAREAGVSPTAPYRHFPSKQCLLAAIAAQGFQTLREEHLRTAAKGLAPEPRLQTMAMSYINFAQTSPSLRSFISLATT
ncbi:MAG: TetR/AcrR family transcriptional regulator [Pseudomonadota bacterium]